MQDDELLEMAKSLNPSTLWRKAFEIYNSDKNNAPLSIGCRSCYNKVLVYFLKIRFSKE